MLLAFELSMPKVNSWNGRWSGEEKLYVKVLNVEKTKPGQYEYDFGDGWQARVTVREVDSKTASKLRRESEGFCGYDWMCNEIIIYGRIRTRAEREAIKEDI